MERQGHRNVGAEVEFKVLGPVEVANNGSALNIGGPKQKTVLAMLIANLSFISPATVRRWADPLAGRIAMMLTGAK